MPVKFFPEIPIDLLERYIVKEDGSPLKGEIDVYRKIHEDCGASPDDWFVWHDLDLPFHSQTFNPYRKDSAQIDFLVLSKKGLIVVEVKGGPVSQKDQHYYYGRNHEDPMPQHPFKQAKGYKFTLKDKVLNVGQKCFICHCVAFPHQEQKLSHNLIEEKLIWAKVYSDQYNHRIDEFFDHVYNHWLTRHSNLNRSFPGLNSNGMSNVAKSINPDISDSNKYYNIDTTEWLRVHNLEILEGLTKNDRIMIEGGPGTGKTTIAKAFIDKHKSKNALYVVWNKFLKVKVEHDLKKRGLNGVTVTTLGTYLLSISDISTDELLRLGENDFEQKLQAAIKVKIEAGELDVYDFVIIDEAQDVFDRGIEHMLTHCCNGSSNGLLDGNSLVLYDIDQSYDMQDRSVREMEELIRPYYSHFRLSEVKRSSQNPGIRKACALIAEKKYDQLDNIEGVSTLTFDGLNQVKNYLVKNVIHEMRTPKSSLKGQDCVVLVESSLMYSKENDPGADFYFMVKDMEELTEENICDTSNTLKFTTPLKYKGLEQQNVFMVLNKISDFNQYEAYVGCTRAISNLQIITI